jgi:threonine 3-dehydrogenase
VLTATAAQEKLKQRIYNVTSFSFTPAELAASIRTVMPSFTIQYKPDFRQAIADTWPRSIDDSQARADWGWANDYDVQGMSKHMLEALTARYLGNAPKP